MIKEDKIMKNDTKVNHKKIYKLIYFLLTVLIILSSIYVINFFSLKQEAKEQSNLLNAISIYQNKTKNEETQNISSEEKETIEEVAEENTRSNFRRECRFAKSENRKNVASKGITRTKCRYCRLVRN